MANLFYECKKNSWNRQEFGDETKAIIVAMGIFNYLLFITPKYSSLRFIIVHFKGRVVKQWPFTESVGTKEHVTGAFWKFEVKNN